MPKKVKVQLVYCPTCPILEPTREALSEAREKFGKAKVSYSEINVHDPANSPDLKHWPSPAILINGREFEGIAQNPNQPCRLFQGVSNSPDVGKLLRVFEQALSKTNP